MRRTAAYTVMTLLAALLLQGCLVHEWPSPPGTVQVRLILEYDTSMDTTEHGYGTRAVSIPEGSDIRYIVRAFPLVKGSKASQECAGEFVFSADASMGYDTEMTLELPEGDYSIMVWSDLVDDGSTDDRHYNTSDFSAVSLNGDSHPGNTDERDAFRGTGEIALRSSIAEKAPDTLRLMMERPLAKYEFIADDLAEFIEKQAQQFSEQNGDGAGQSSVNLDDYRVVIYYTGFMPDTYSLFTDKPVDSSTGVFFETGLTQISDTEASLGFDYCHGADRHLRPWRRPGGPDRPDRGAHKPQHLHHNARRLPPLRSLRRHLPQPGFRRRPQPDTVNIINNSV